MKQADAAGKVATTPTIQYDPFRTAELELQPSLGSASSAKAKWEQWWSNYPVIYVANPISHELYTRHGSSPCMEIYLVKEGPLFWANSSLDPEATAFR